MGKVDHEEEPDPEKITEDLAVPVGKLPSEEKDENDQTKKKKES
jgi:hypothetical protein